MLRRRSLGVHDTAEPFLADESWTPSGFNGRMFKTMKPYAPAPPPAAQPTPWGDETHVCELLGDRVSDVAAEGS